VRRFFRYDDWVVRYQPYTIAALLPKATLEQAVTLADRGRTMLEERLVLMDYRTDARVPVSLHAVAVGTERVEAPLDRYHVLQTADAALERVRSTGNRRVEERELRVASVTLLGAAALLDCSPAIVRRLVREGQLAGAKLGRHYEIDRRSIDHYRRAVSTEA
jgi:excisionase family DNA binding protein